MGSLYSNQVRNSLSSNIRHGCSKAQMCLTKILHIITSIPSQESSNTTCSSLFCKNSTGFNFDIDLNMGLCPFWENNEEESESLSACSFVGNKVIESVNDLILESATKIGEKVTNLESESSVQVEVGDQELKVNRKDFEGVDRLGLLIEAAELISCKETADESESESKLSGDGGGHEMSEEANGGSKRKILEEDTSPVVRSKRGRNQVLPYRYRDSVLDPWKRLARPQRSRRSR